MILGFIKGLLGGPDYEFRKISAGYLFKKKTEMGTEKYAKWLRRKNASCEAMIIIQKEKGLAVPQFWIDAFELIKDERRKIEEI